MVNKAKVFKQDVPASKVGRMHKHKPGRNSLPKLTGSKKDNGQDKKSPVDFKAIINKNLDAHFKQNGMLKAEERAPRKVGLLFQLYYDELSKGWWPENIWLWKQGFNRAEMELLRKELVRRLK